PTPKKTNTKIKMTDDTILSPEFATLIRKARMKKGLTHEQLGTQMNEKAMLLRKFETGALKPDEILAKKLERFLGIKLYVSIEEVVKTSQQYNLASLCQVEIIDRERLILEIFERRASTAESRIQIKLAQLRYDMVRAREKVRLAKIGEQPGFFGMGKYDADIYYLDINKRAAVLKKKLEREEKRRDLHRVQRSKAGLSIISIAGY